MNSKIIRYLSRLQLISKRKLNAASVVPKSTIVNTPSHDRQIVTSPNTIGVIWAEKLTSIYHNVWLRDHCQCEECLHPLTKQRLVHPSNIPQDIKSTAIEQSEQGLTIHWNHPTHTSFYEWSWLHRHSYNPRLQTTLLPQKELWNYDIQHNLPTVEYQAVMNSDDGVAEWTSKIYRYGFCFVDGVPASSEETEKLLSRIAFIRTTHFGGFWNFTSNLAKADLAYTTAAIEAHTDTSYFTDPVGLQMLHLLKFDGEGGKTLLIDGFRAAQILREEDPAAYKILSTVRVPSHTVGDEDTFIQPTTPSPILGHNISTGQLEQIRWNNGHRSVADQWDNPDNVTGFYDAMRKWNEILTRKDSELWIQLQPGRPLIFDNWRTLHGRSAFSGCRQMCGGYINRDDYMSRLRLTNLGREEILKRLF
ncbi:unnamed protein product [Adineta ricciae]|uniref:Trimethyllysine dioxygenase, mitochondrial n=1 Tax=Adineta ricciae TaxID=249248 RepID=A0A814BLL4_ADIRI|nr:unnamed protein product [Adineta ricciae]CAF1282869.1 unnamed protein product [Adineta ricciae]